MVAHCKSKKYNKRVFLFTNGMGGSELEGADMGTLGKKLVSNGIKLNVIPIDFMVSYNPS